MAEGEPSFGTLLASYRRAAGLTQEALAERAGLSVRGISDLERGQRTAPQAHTVRALAAALRLEAPERAALEAAARRGPVLPARRDGEPAAPASSRGAGAAHAQRQRRHPWILPLLAVALGGLVGGGVLAVLAWRVSSGDAAVAPSPAPTCRGSATSVAIQLAGEGRVATQEFVTSERCLDINVRFTVLPEATNVRAVQCRRQGDWSTVWVPFQPNDTGWRDLATNMRDGTCFHLELQGTSGKPYEVVIAVAS